MAMERSDDSKILQRLEEWAQRNGSLPPVIETYEKLLRLQSEARSRLIVQQPDLTKEAALSQLSQGIPLLKFEELPLDWPTVQNLFRAVALILTEHNSDNRRDTKALGNIASDTSLLQQSARDWYQGHSLSPIAAQNHISEKLLSNIIQATLRPFLMAHSEALSKLIKQEIWRRKNCPVCGGNPDFASLDKDQGARWLMCSRCDTQWLFQRLQCSSCGTQDHDALAYLTDDEGLYRIYTCEKCQSYIKAIDLRKTGSEVLLPLERILTSDLDRQATEKGYKSV